MSIRDSGSTAAEINVTPMIDILLVLLIMFMVIMPVAPKGLDALVARPARTTQPNPERAVVVEAFGHPGGAATFKLNDTDVSRSELLPRLAAIYANRAERVMFVRGDDKSSFADIAEVIDIGRAANVDHIGLMTPGSQGSASRN